jgi:hypothetical protein
MHLLTFENWEMKVSPELLLIKSFRDLYRSDKTRNKEFFLKELSYIYFMIDPRSTYMYITDEKKRSETIIQQEDLKNTHGDFQINDTLKECMKWYKKHTTTTSTLMLEDTLIAADKIREFLRNIDFSKVDANGKPVYNVQQVTSAMKNIMDIIPQLKELEKKVTRDVEDKTRTGVMDKNMFEDESPVYKE